MKKKFKNLFLNKIISVLIVVILVFNFCLPTYSLGIDFGGVLFKPTSTILVTAIDAINGLIGIFLGGMNELTGLDGIDDLSDVLASPEYIFAGKYPILNANLFKAGNNNSNTDIGTVINDVQNGAGTSIIQKLREAVSGMYYLLRNMCAVVLLCLLIYTGIRIVLSASMPEEQAKWKGYLIDWIKALALLIFIHLIMIAIFNMTDLLANALIDALGEGLSISQILREQCLGSLDFVPQAMALIMYGYCTYLIIIFSLSYFKRVLWTAILIILAPIVSALYAIGGQGKTMYKGWFKEYLVNCLIQPFHVIIYYMLIMLPVTIGAQSNEQGLLSILSAGVADGKNNIFLLIYCLIAMSLMRPAEKFIRQLFGMNGGKIANTASFDSGKQLADAIGNAIKQTIITAVSIGATVATGGATAGLTGVTNAGKMGQTATTLGQGANPINPGIGGNNPLGGEIGQGIREGLQNTPVGQGPGDGIGELNGSMGISGDAEQNSGSENTNNGEAPAPTISQNPQAMGGTESIARLINDSNTQGPKESNGLLDRLINKVGGRYLDTPEKTKNTFDAIDKLYEWKHMIGDVGKEFGDLEAGPGHRPMRMTPFLRERVNNQFVEEEKQLNAMAERFANDGSVIDFYRKRIENDTEKLEQLRQRYTRDITDENGNKKPFFDKLKYEEDIKGQAEREAQKSSEFIKYGYTDLYQIDYMRQNAKDAGIKRTEDVIRYNANYDAVAKSMIESGNANSANINTEEIQSAIREGLKYLEPGQNVQGAQIPPKISQNEVVPRANARILSELSKIGKDLEGKVSNENKIGDVKAIHNVIEYRKNTGNEIPNMNKLPKDIQEYIKDNSKQ